MLENKSDRWVFPMRLMHGIGMGLVLILIIHGWWMTEFAPREARFGQYAWHASFGYALLLVTALRITWRGLYKAPEPPADSLKWERNLAALGHMALYAFMLSCAILGWALAGTFSQPLEAKLLGFIPVPMIMSGDEIHGLLEEKHAFFAWTLAALVILHLLATAYHQLYKKDKLLQRMFFK